MKKLLVSLGRDEEAQDLVEYAMLIALIALIAAVGIRAFGAKLNTWFNDLAGSVPLS